MTLNLYYLRYYAIKNKNYWLTKNVRCGDSPSFVSILWRKRRAEDVQMETMNRNGKIFGVKQLGYNIIFCADTQIIGSVLSKEFATFTNRRVSSYLISNF